MNCGDPGQGVNATRFLIDGGFDYGHQVAFDCWTGYWENFQINRIVQCLSNGNWNEIPLVCSGKFGKPRDMVISNKKKDFVFVS